MVDKYNINDVILITLLKSTRYLEFYKHGHKWHIIDMFYVNIIVVKIGEMWWFERTPKQILYSFHEKWLTTNHQIVKEKGIDQWRIKKMVI